MNKDLKSVLLGGKMKNSKITRKITQGMYILTTVGGGCIVDAVARVGGTEQIMIDLLYRC